MPVIDFPPDLPVSARRDEIAAAIAAHPVVIVCGETGSGKTTQLPKIVLSLGRGRLNAPPGTRGQIIGHTQPRRIAASSVAKRIAQELKTPLGEVVGFKVRFQDRLQPGASVKLMTDGILLAETQSDPLLKAYDTLIIDEAHERSLNIDFLLGYLKRILPRRPDLKLIVTSATIDADRFARFFAGPDGPAPVLTVSGRLYPVEQRWRPFEESRDHGLPDAIAEAVDELWAGSGARPRGGGDILVFLPGEREIREAADHLRRHLAHSPLTRQAEVLPLFSRLSQAEQDRIFEPHDGRRIVLATNVAETSLTVPGIRYVIDTGTARVKRYSYRSKVEQLLVEPISQAAANQRAGRCGRVADGICIRLYDEKDFAGRPRFTDPELLRSSLAGVILRMKSLGLGSVDEFDFLEAPSKRAIADGWQLLAELGAVDEQLHLTPVGRSLARLPLDPRVGRMILRAHELGALDEVLVVAAALSVQDVRERPLNAQTQADQAQAKFRDERSEFSGLIKLWQWLGDARGGAAHDGQAAQHKLSNRQYEQLLRSHYLSPRRVREWRDIHSQLVQVAADQGLKPRNQPATYEAIHRAMLAGLLGNIGFKAPEDDHYLGARGIRFFRHPGAHLAKKSTGRWIVCAELVETTRLFGRGIAHVEPTWIEDAAPHLIRRETLDPQWDARSGQVMAFERGTLYGLLVYSGRKVRYAGVDPAAAREIFIRQALVEARWDTAPPFLAANRKLVRQVEELEHKSRRQDVLVDDEFIFAFYDQQIPQDVCDTAGLTRWWEAERARQPRQQTPLLQLTRDELMRHEAAGITTEAFPKLVRLGGVDCAATYLHEPGDSRDGVTVTVPIFALNQVSEDRLEWLVPGMLQAKIQALLKSLPQRPRSRFVPLPDSAARLAAQFNAPEVFGGGSLIDALVRQARSDTSLDIKRTDFKLDMVGAHLFMNLRVVDEHGRQLGMGRSLAALKSQWGEQARSAFAALAVLRRAQEPSNKASNSPSTTKSEPNTPAASVQSSNSAIKKEVFANPSSPALDSTTRHTRWDFGELPELMEVRRGAQSLVGFPALIDGGDAVTIEVFDEPEVAAARHRAGLRRLFALQLRDALKYLDKNLPDSQAVAASLMAMGQAAGAWTPEAIRAQILDVAIDRAFAIEPWPSDAAAFEARVAQGRPRLTLVAGEVARLAAQILTELAAAQRKLRDLGSKAAANPIWAQAQADVAQQLPRLVPPAFLLQTPWAQLQHLPRYLKAITLRLDKLRADAPRDAQRLAELKPLEQRYWRLLAERKGQADARLADYRWLLEELRVSFFAQELRTPQPVSVKRLDKVWEQIQR